MTRSNTPPHGPSKKDSSVRALQLAERRAKQAMFLERFTASGEIGPAAKAAGIDRASHYDWLKSDAHYAQRFAEAQVMRVEVLETEVRRRALVGWDEPVFYKGEKIADVRKFSDVLLIFALKGEKPEKYREHYQHEHVGPGGTPVTFTLKLGVMGSGNGHVG